MITDFPGLSIQLEIMVWQIAVTIPTERRPLQSQRRDPQFSPQASKELQLTEYSPAAARTQCSVISI